MHKTLAIAAVLAAGCSSADSKTKDSEPPCPKNELHSCSREEPAPRDDKPVPHMKITTTTTPTTTAPPPDDGDPLSGLYDLEQLTLTSGSCDTAAAKANDVTRNVVYGKVFRIRVVAGHLFLDKCGDDGDCDAKPTLMRWVFTEKSGDAWTGAGPDVKGSETLASSDRTCFYSAETATLTPGEDGAATIAAKTLSSSTTLAEPGECDKSDAAFAAAQAKFTCSQLETLRLKKR
jgi:hypothetical protein